MKYQIVIDGRLHGLNEFIAANRQHPKAGNRMKKEAEGIITQYVRKYMKDTAVKEPVVLHYKYYEMNEKRDLDNISGFFHKVFQDAMVRCGILKNDGWKNIRGFTDEFYVDKNRPRIEVIIEETEKQVVL